MFLRQVKHTPQGGGKTVDNLGIPVDRDRSFRFIVTGDSG
jgi:hypothetical protein